MPLGLVKKTWPGAVMRPKIWLGLLSSTRLSVALELEGCTKFTLAALPRLKVFQLSTAEALLWFTLSVAVPVCAVVAWPATTWPPVGSWVGAGAAA